MCSLKHAPESTTKNSLTRLNFASMCNVKQRKTHCNLLMTSLGSGCFPISLRFIFATILRSKSVFMGKTNLYFNCKTFKDTRAIFKAFKLSCNRSLLWFQTSVLTTNFASDHTEVPSFAFILHFTIVLYKIL